MQSAETVLVSCVVTGEPDDQETIMSGSEGGRTEKDLLNRHLAVRPTLRIGCSM